MANTVEDFTTAHDKAQELKEKQQAVDELTQWNTDLDDDTAKISAKLVKEIGTNTGQFTAMFLEEPTFTIQSTLKTAIQTAITNRINTLNSEIETLKDEIEALIVP